MKIFLVFKTHFDIGFTDLAENIIGQYAHGMLDDVIETCEGTQEMGKLRYVWTMPSWPLTVMQRNEQKRETLDRLVQEGQIAIHALPFTVHTDFSGIEDLIDGLKYAVRLSEEYHIPLPISAKMTDVPGHGRILPTVLARAGVHFLHLGCNEFATPPQVPPLFFWEGPDGSRVLTMYNKGGYGSSMVPPADWPYPVWMALMHTHDNCGPQSAQMIREMVEEAQEIYPDAEIQCGTMDDFYRALAACDLSGVPVVTGDLADTWIHGAGTYPAETSLIRQARRELVTAGAAALYAGAVDQKALAQAIDRAGDALSLFDEHTWGVDVKTWMDPDRVYEKQEFLRKKETPEYQRMERSWNEQRERAWTARDMANQAMQQVQQTGTYAVFNPNGSLFTGWVPANVPEAIELCGIPHVYAEHVPALGAVSVKPATWPTSTHTLENHRYRLTIDREIGQITELYDKQLGHALLRAREGMGVFAYQYDVYGIEDMTEYLRAYAYRFSDWGVRDNGRDHYPECPHRTFRPACIAIEEHGYTVTLIYQSEAWEAYGDARTIHVSVALPPAGDELFVRVEAQDKQETPYVESATLLLPLAEEAPRYRFNKNGDLIDPTRDIVSCANHVFYCLEAFACAEGEHDGLCVVSKDTALCTIGETGVYAYRKNYEPHLPVLCFNLYNTMWGTNFPQWIGGDLAWNFTLFGYRGHCGGDVLSRALSLNQGAAVLRLPDNAPAWKLPGGVQVMAVRPIDRGWMLDLRDTGLTRRHVALHMPGFRITQTDLRGTRIGTDACEHIYGWEMVPFGLYRFILEEL